MSSERFNPYRVLCVRDSPADGPPDYLQDYTVRRTIWPAGLNGPPDWTVN